MAWPAVCIIYFYSISLYHCQTHLVNAEVTPLVSEKVFEHFLHVAYHFPPFTWKPWYANATTNGATLWSLALSDVSVSVLSLIFYKQISNSKVSNMKPETKTQNYVCLLLLVLCSNILASSWVLYWVLITYV